jgi:hypothetical protein
VLPTLNTPGIAGVLIFDPGGSHPCSWPLRVGALAPVYFLVSCVLILWRWRERDVLATPVFLNTISVMDTMLQQMRIQCVVITISVWSAVGIVVCTAFTAGCDDISHYIYIVLLYILCPIPYLLGCRCSCFIYVLFCWTWRRDSLEVFEIVGAWTRVSGVFYNFFSSWSVVLDMTWWLVFINTTSY